MFDVDQMIELATVAVATWAPRVFGALAVLVFGWVFAGWVRGFAQEALKRSPLDDILIPFLSGLLHAAVIALVAVTALGVLGISTASFVAVLGAAGLAVALAFQGTFSNFAAGIMLLTFRPFDVGDYVEVGGEAGTVQEVGIFSCILTTPDNVEISVPNTGIFGATIRNYSANETRRIDLVISVGYDDDLGVAARTCMDTISADPRILADPVPRVAVAELADSSVNLVVRPWVKREDYWDVRFDLTRALKENLEAAGCSIPYPQQDVHHHEVNG